MISPKQDLALIKLKMRQKKVRAALIRLYIFYDANHSKTECFESEGNYCMRIMENDLLVLVARTNTRNIVATNRFLLGVVV